MPPSTLLLLSTGLLPLRTGRSAVSFPHFSVEMIAPWVEACVPLVLIAGFISAMGGLPVRREAGTEGNSPGCCLWLAAWPRQPGQAAFTGQAAVVRVSRPLCSCPLTAPCLPTCHLQGVVQHAFYGKPKATNVDEWDRRVAARDARLAQQWQQKQG